MKEFVQRVKADAKDDAKEDTDGSNGDADQIDTKADEQKTEASESNESKETAELPLGNLSRTDAPPRKPFTKGPSMSDKSAPNYTPEIPRKVVDVPNPISSGRAYTPATTTPDEGKRLVVGKEIALSGEISTCDTLVVEGKVEANLADARVIEVVEGGLFKGEAEVTSAIISGTFDGKLTVKDRLEVQPNGLVKGEVKYQTITIESGGRVDGKMKPLD